MNNLQQYPHEKNQPQSLVVKIWKGDAGLAKTYWFWGVAINFLLVFLLGFSIHAFFLAPLFFAYFAFIYVGIWRAATKFKGKKVWATLAKISIVLAAFLVLRASLLVLPTTLFVYQKVVS